MKCVTIRASVANYFIEWGERYNLYKRLVGFGKLADQTVPHLTVEWEVGRPSKIVELVIYDDSTWLQVSTRSGYLISEIQYEHIDPAFPFNIEQIILGHNV